MPIKLKWYCFVACFVTNVVIHFICQIFGRNKNKTLFSKKKVDRNQKKHRKLPHSTASKLNIFFSNCFLLPETFSSSRDFFLFKKKFKKNFYWLLLLYLPQTLYFFHFSLKDIKEMQKKKSLSSKPNVNRDCFIQ